jgi:hypothetical protein
MATSTGRRTARLVLLAICGLAIVALVGAIVRQSAQSNSTATELVRTEGEGATALHPMLALVGDLVEAQSAAVRGASMSDAETAINKAIDQITGIDPEYGVKLQTGPAITDLANQIHAVLADKPTGRPAYEAFSGLVTLAVNLMRQTADTSHLIHDPEVDSYFVMDAAVTRLPDALVYSGRAADLVALGGGRQLDSTDEISAAVGRFYVSNSASQVSSGLNQSIDFTSNSALGGNIADRLDQFMAAAAVFAPPTMITDLSTPVSDPATFAANARKVYATALSLAHFLITQLQNLLGQREEGLEAQWRFTATTAGAAGLIGLVMVWLLALGRTQGSHARGAAAGDGTRESGDDLPVSPLTDAQQLLDQEELVHVGRAVRPRARGRGDAF